ncbi:hypothetical protein ABG067_000585 [Albugo candida]
MGSHDLINMVELGSAKESAISNFLLRQNLRDLNRSAESDGGNLVKTEQAQIGDQLEISPASITIIQEIAKRISVSRGAALIVNFGHDHPFSFSLREN